MSSAVLQELVELLALERLEENLFRGQSQDLGWGAVYGGQVLGQALSAASRTVSPDRSVHSLNAYFLRPGDVSLPIVYDVDRIRDGHSFTTRRVVAIQKGEAIFNLAASFQKPEPGLSHQDPMPDVPAPETLPTDQERMAKLADKLPAALRKLAEAERPFEMRSTTPKDAAEHPVRHVWFKTASKLPDDPALHAYLLAYASDYSFLTTSLLPHGIHWPSPGLQIASVDHVMWFHEPLRVDTWMLHTMDSPKATGARGLVRGRIFSQDGRLVASTAQEGLIRQRPIQP